MIKDLLEQHALEVAFLWTLRDTAASAPHYDLPRLDDLDERIEAHLDGLRIGGEESWKVCEKALAAEEAGEIFAAAVLAVEQADEAKLAAVIDATGDDRALGRGLVSALGWVPFEQAQPILAALLAPERPPAHRRLGIAGHAVHRVDPGAALTNALFADSPELRTRAIRAAGELGRADLLPQIRAELGSDDGERRFWSAWSAALLGEPAASSVLWEIAESRGPRASEACAVAVRRTSATASVERLEVLAAYPERGRTTVIGAGALGDPSMVPFLLDRMSAPPLARIAGDAFTTITGIRIERALATKAPEGFVAGPTDDPSDDDVSMDPDQMLSWPAPSAVREAWNARPEKLARGVRHLLGGPITQDALLRVLREGNQRRRASAALELALRSPVTMGEPPKPPSPPLFAVRAPAARQARALAQLAAPKSGSAPRAR